METEAQPSNEISHAKFKSYYVVWKHSKYSDGPPNM